MPRRRASSSSPRASTFRQADFASPIGPGNPLAAALRAIRENMCDRGNFDPQRDGEPYPLLLVRPRGIADYYLAREAMQWWTSDFGYELIDDDWKLTFPPPDPQMARLLQQATAAARTELAQSRAAMPSRSERRQPSFRVASSGGVVPENSYDEDDEDDSLAPGEQTGGGGGGGNGFGPGGSGGAGGPGGNGLANGGGNGFGPGGNGFGSGGNGFGGGSASAAMELVSTVEAALAPVETALAMNEAK